MSSAAYIGGVVFSKILRAGEGRMVRRLQAIANAVNSIEENYTELTDAELRESGCQHGAPTSAESEPEGAEKLGSCASRQVHDVLSLSLARRETLRLPAARLQDKSSAFPKRATSA